ncbi:Predicted oxidoreductase [Actinopolymorpha cephalotaxi]|uniref:Predicted oxidoreductase n=1 Tax=Actinopolymorpha cephalotaxi TaxID=504797 RepID=A0A1I2PC23_9ACTN|nr:aldo/keto reductase [Actinopolymorpha cephalotaxi]NYH83688.1 aryl-alcohol dehydrogenase-like predicted oxidoreductase [Actinopolymorpha cephalotaxi]SFG13030.1 Predicted oxidoreductase [Actinopolymorpha cephalotaxi]
MDYRLLGATGLEVSELCLGAMMFGSQTDEQTSTQILDTFTEAGGNFVDTADVYGDGRSEEVLGRWLKGRRREDLVVATKVWGPMGAGRNDRGLSRKHILDAVEASLRRLGTDHIDLYQLHRCDPATPMAETLSTLDLLVRTGKVRYVGVSNFSGWQLQKAIDLCRQHSWESPASLQPLYNLLDREAEWELLPVCRNEGVGVITWSPLRSGWLSGAYRRGMTAPPANSKVSSPGTHSWERYGNEHTWRVVDELVAVATEVGCTPARVAIRWLLQRPGVTAPIIGARTHAHLDDALGAVGWSLSPGQVSRLDAASEPERLPYPYNLAPLLDRSRQP